MRSSKILKAIPILIIHILSCKYVMAQRICANEIVHIDFPAGMKPMPDEELQFRINRQKNEPLRPTGVSGFTGEYYKIDSFVLALFAFQQNIPENYLEKRKKAFELDREVKCNCSYEIKIINNYTVLISSIISPEWVHYFFSCVNKNHTALLNGSLFYDKPDACTTDNAMKLLNKLLDNTVFITDAP